MAKIFDIHPVNPQLRLLEQVAQILQRDGVIAYPTDSCYALGASIDNRGAEEVFRRIRQLGENHDFTLVCSDLAQVGSLVAMDNATFRAIKSATPGAYTFILPATKEVPKRLAHPKKKTIGVRIPDSPIISELLSIMGAPLLSSTLILPGDTEAMTEAWQIDDRIGKQLQGIIDAGSCGFEPTTVVDFTSGYAEVVREGAGDPSPFM